MTEFNRMFQVVQVLVLSLLLAGCVKASKHKVFGEEETRQTTFRMSESAPVVDVTGYAPDLLMSANVEYRRTADVSVEDRGNANYSNRREYSLSLCGLQDIRAQNSIIGQKMRVYSELNIKNADLEVQGDNCVYWQVSLPYNYFAEAVNLEVNFVLMTTAGPKAYIHKKILINPWDAKRGSNPEFFDFTRFGLSDEVRQQRAARGFREIELALKGELTDSVKKLEVGSLTIYPVDKQHFESNMIGKSLSDDVAAEKRRNEELRASLQAAQDGTNRPAYEAFQSLDLMLNVRLNNLKVRLRDSAGQVFDQELQTGRYRIYAQLLATDANQNGHFLITDRMIVSDEKNWNTTTMGVNAVIPISVVIRPQWGNLQLALRVEPVDLAGRILPFEALYNLGRFNEIGGGNSPLFATENYDLRSDNQLSFSFENYVKSSQNYDKWLQGRTSEGVQGVSTFEAGFRRFQFTNLNVLFSRIMAGDTATDRTIQYTVETCVIDNLTGARPGGGLVFEIETEDRGIKTVMERKTNELGCLNWVGMISHKFYHRENLVQKFSKLTYKGNNNQRLVYNLDYYINPWDEKFTFGRDSRILPPEYIEQIRQQQAVAPPTRLLITGFKYDATGFRYVIDRYMNMTVKKTVLMSLDPKILKYNSIVWGRSGFSDIRDGIYLMKIAMQKDYLDPAAPGREILYQNGQYRVKSSEETMEMKQFLVVKEMLVRVLGGQIVTPVEFDVTDLRTLRIRSQMLIQIETIDEMLLRAVFLANEKLTDLITPPGVSRTSEIIRLQATEDEVNRRLQEAKKQADSEELRAMIASLETEKRGIAEKLQGLLSSLDSDSMAAVLSSIENIRALGESDVSVDRNLKYQALNNILNGMRRKIENHQSTQQRTIMERYADRQAADCEQTRQSLLNQGRSAEAALFDPARGELCFKQIPPEELFYHLVSSGDLEADDVLKSLFTGEEYQLYKTGGLRDDFTNAYIPAYEFSLLSNQGDEFTAANPEFTSGLPRRTFIGPVTFVLNGNSSAMRPTDVLDEAFCQGTCEQLAIVENQIINSSGVIQDAVKSFGLPVNSAYEESPYFGSIRHFYKKQVNDLISMERGLRFQYHQEMRAFSQIGNLLESMLLNYVSFGERQTHVKYLDYPCYADWKNKMEESYIKWREDVDLSFQVEPISDTCFKNSTRAIHKDSFTTSFNAVQTENQLLNSRYLTRHQLPQVTSAQLKEFSKNGMVSSKINLDTKINILHRMCYQLRKNLIPSNVRAYQGTLEKRVNAEMDAQPMGFMVIRATAVPYKINEFVGSLNGFEDSCHESVDFFAKDLREVYSKLSPIELRDFIATRMKNMPMIVERKVRVRETSDRYLYKDGKTINYSVSTSFSLSNSFNVNRGLKVDPIETAEKTLGVFGKVGEGLSTFIGAVAGTFNFQWGAGEGMSDSNGTSISSGTTIAGQISTLDIELKEWEKCVVVRYNEQKLLDHLKGISGKHGFYSPYEDMQGLGTMMCSGEYDTEDDLNPGQPLVLRERYYYFTQIFNDGDMQDSGALINHPWMLQLRGVRDFSRFHKALTVSGQNLNYGSAYQLAMNDIGAVMAGAAKQKELGLTSLQVVDPNDVSKALDMMSEAYERSLPTFPGMYTYSDSSMDDVSGWVTSTPGR